eukprot:6169295-Prymnesium_polylepis.1
MLHSVRLERKRAPRGALVSKSEFWRPVGVIHVGLGVLQPAVYASEDGEGEGNADAHEAEDDDVGDGQHDDLRDEPRHVVPIVIGDRAHEGLKHLHIEGCHGAADGIDAARSGVVEPLNGGQIER